MPRTRAYQHQVLPTSFCLFIFSRSSFSLVRYCLYSLNSFRVQTTYRETRADDSQELLWQLPTQPSRNVQAPQQQGSCSSPPFPPQPWGRCLLPPSQGQGDSTLGCQAPPRLSGNPCRGDLCWSGLIQTYFAILGDKAPVLQVLQVVFAVVVVLQIWVMQAVVFCAQMATVWISQIKIRRRLVKLEEMCCRV